jgi:hypothetical protein
MLFIKKSEHVVHELHLPDPFIDLFDTKILITEWGADKDTKLLTRDHATFRYPDDTVVIWILELIGSAGKRSGRSFVNFSRR